MANNYEEFSEILSLDSGYDKAVLKTALDEHLKDNGEEEAEFSYEFLDEGLWLYSEGFGDPFKAADYASRVMNAFKMSGHFFLNYCYRCDKPRPGEFGGGARIVTKDGVKALGMNDICIHEIANALNNGASVHDEIPVML